MEKRDCVIVGAGPCGLSTAVELKIRGFEPLIIEKGCIVNAIYGYPTFMHFFSTPELLEIGRIPFITQGEKPTRLEALKYYRAVADYFALDIHQYEKVTDVKRSGNGLTVYTDKGVYATDKVVVATGYFDNPNFIGVPGEDMPHVHHYFKEAHPHYGQEVVVIGGKNSAVEAAMELQRTGADVTMVYRRSAFTSSVKAWVKPVIESAINKGLIQMYWNSNVVEITENSVVIDQNGELHTLPCDVVYALTGYRPDYTFLKQIGVRIDRESGVPEHNPETMETNVPGVYIAGVIVSGNDANRIFIENGRFHGVAIAEHLQQERAANALRHNN